MKHRVCLVTNYYFFVTANLRHVFLLFFEFLKCDENLFLY